MQIRYLWPDPCPPFRAQCSRLTRGLSDRLRVLPSGLDGGEAEVSDLDSEVVVVQEDVVALQVAVNDVLRVEVAGKRK